MAAHGFEQLKKHWDPHGGGFRQRLSRTGAPIGSATKTAYGNAFAIFGLAAYIELARDSDALALAQQAFDWLEDHSHDPEHGGYFQFIGPDGTPEREGQGNIPPKDQNSSIHLLEAFTALLQVWPDPQLRKRLAELMVLIRDVMVHDGRYLRLFFWRDWTPDSFARTRDHELDHVSFGHDIETAHLLLEASRALGMDEAATKSVAQTMVDHALRHGWDEEEGGIFDKGYFYGEQCTIVSDAKVWWTQFEALHTLLQMAALFPTRYHTYTLAALELWRYMKSYLLCPDYGSCYWAGLDTSPHHRRRPKGEAWKTPYHTYRGLTAALERIADGLGPPPISAMQP